MKAKHFLFVAGLILLGWIYSCTRSLTPIPPPPASDSTGTTSDTAVDLKMGLLLYLPFDGNIADSSGNGNPTEAVGGNVLTYDAHGYANNAFGGNGTGQRIIVTNNGSIAFDTAFSLSFDFMINASARQAFVTMVDTLNGYGPSFITSTSIVGLPNIDFYANDISGGCDNIASAAAPAIGDTSTLVPLPGAWYNVVNIYHKGSIQTYVNGRLTASVSGNGTAALDCPGSQVIIGGWWNGDPITLNGKLDEVRLYNRVLNAHEIATLAQNFQVTSEKSASKPQNGQASLR